MSGSSCGTYLVKKFRFVFYLVICLCIWFQNSYIRIIRRIQSLSIQELWHALNFLYLASFLIQFNQKSLGDFFLFYFTFNFLKNSRHTKGVAEDRRQSGWSQPTVTAGVGSRRLALAVASQSLAFVRAIARAKPKAARRKTAGKPDGWGDGV